MEIIIGLAILLLLKAAKLAPFAEGFEGPGINSLKRAGLR
jgi:hypothetical protein